MFIPPHAWTSPCRPPSGLPPLDDAMGAYKIVPKRAKGRPAGRADSFGRGILVPRVQVYNIYIYICIYNKENMKHLYLNK